MTLPENQIAHIPATAGRGDEMTEISNESGPPVIGWNEAGCDLPVSLAGPTTNITKTLHVKGHRR